MKNTVIIAGLVTLFSLSAVARSWNTTPKLFAAKAAKGALANTKMDYSNNRITFYGLPSSNSEVLVTNANGELELYSNVSAGKSFVLSGSLSAGVHTIVIKNGAESKVFAVLGEVVVKP